MKRYNGRFFYCLALGIIGYGTNNLKIAAVLISIVYLVNLIIASKDYIAFREYALAIYGVNYLLAPAVMFNYNGVDFLAYTMKGDPNKYFEMATLGVLSLHLGLFIYNSKIFQNRFTLAEIQTKLNGKVLRTWVYGGFIIGFLTSKLPLPQELNFFLILLSGLRFVGVFGLIALNAKKFKYEIIAIFGYELYTSISWGFFHDLVIWYIFLGLYLSFVFKIKLVPKIIAGLVFILLTYILQNVKGEYRNTIWTDGYESNSIETFSEVAKNKTSQAGFLSEQQIVQTLVRVNQGWILASTIDNVDRNFEFAGTEILYKYIEAALLPRFLAPDKLQAGDKVLFNKYSGHNISSSTSMALGIIADGYIANGPIGILLVCFGLGLCFTLVFFMVEKWSEISPFFILMLFPILYYAVRPDCETQTTMGQLVKGSFTYWLIVVYYRGYFKKQTILLQRLEEALLRKKMEVLERIKLKSINQIS